MRTTAIVTAVALAALGAADTSSARAGHHPTCAKAGSRTVASTKAVRVFSVKNKESGRNLYGCLRANGRRQLLTRSFDDGYVTSSTYGHVRVAGRFVAWDASDTDDSCKADCPPGYEPTSYIVAVRDLNR